MFPPPPEPENEKGSAPMEMFRGAPSPPPHLMGNMGGGGGGGGGGGSGGYPSHQQMMMQGSYAAAGGAFPPPPPQSYNNPMPYNPYNSPHMNQSLPPLPPQSPAPGSIVSVGNGVGAASALAMARAAASGSPPAQAHGHGGMGPPPPKSSSPPVQDALVKCTFIPTMPDELQILYGERVRMLMRYDDGWSLCANARGEQGMVPLECLDFGGDGQGAGYAGAPPQHFGGGGSGDWHSMQRNSSLNPDGRF